MKICFFNSAKVWGGGETWHFDHSKAFTEAGHDVFVVSNKNSELLKRAQAQNIKTKAFSIGNLSFLNPFKLISLYRFFKKQQFDVLVMNFSKDLKIAAPMAKRAGIKKIIYRRGSAVPIKNTVLNRFLYGKCLTGIIANSVATKETILQNNPELFPENKIKVIYNGINTKAPQPPKTQNTVPVIGALGRLVYQKGFDILLDIALILKNRQVKCKFIVGGDGVLKDELVAKVHEMGLSDYVEFIGFVEKSAQFMSRIDIFALTSRWEGFGYVIPEAMLAKNPLVAFNISSNPELVFDNVNGLLIPFEDKEAFANAIQELIEQPSKREQLGAGGFKVVCEKFDFETNKKQVVDYLTDGIF